MKSKRKLRLISFFLSACLLAGIPVALAGSGASDIDPCTTPAELRTAILAAAPGETVYIADTIVLTEQLYFQPGYDGVGSAVEELNVILASASGAPAVIDASAIPSYSFNFHGIKNVTLTFDNVVIDGGGKAGSIRFSRGGGTASLPEYLLTLNNVVMQNCSGGNGGAVHVDWDNVALNGCTFTGNYADGNGGAIFVRYGDVVIDNCIFADNASKYNGGAVYVSAEKDYLGSLTATDSEFTGNVSPSFGGAVCGFGEINVQDCLFEDNTALCGGAISGGNEPITVTGGTISGNTASVTASDIQDMIDIYEGAFPGETPRDHGINFDTWADYCAWAFGGGGGIYTPGALSLSDVDFSGNTSNYNGGGILVWDLALLNVADDVLFCGNTADAAWWMSDTDDIELHNKMILTPDRSDSPDGPSFVYAYNNYDIVYLKGNQTPPTYTVTYAPGTQGTFDAQITDGLYKGATTPDAPSITGNTGWIFAGWDPEITNTVTGNITYTAQWEEAPTTQPTIEVTAEPTTQPTIEVTTEPTMQPTIEATAEPTMQPTIEVTTEPTTRPTIEATTEPTTQPTTQATAEPTTEPAPVTPTEAPLPMNPHTGDSGPSVVFALLLSLSICSIFAAAQFKLRKRGKFQA